MALCCIFLIVLMSGCEVFSTKGTTNDKTPSTQSIQNTYPTSATIKSAKTVISDDIIETTDIENVIKDLIEKNIICYKTYVTPDKLSKRLSTDNLCEIRHEYFKSYEELCDFVRATYTKDYSDKLINAENAIFSGDDSTLYLNTDLIATSEYMTNYDDYSFKIKNFCKDSCEVALFLPNDMNSVIHLNVKLEENGWRLNGIPCYIIDSQTLVEDNNYLAVSIDIKKFKIVNTYTYPQSVYDVINSNEYKECSFLGCMIFNEWMLFSVRNPENYDGDTIPTHLLAISNNKKIDFGECNCLYLTIIDDKLYAYNAVYKGKTEYCLNYMVFDFKSGEKIREYYEKYNVDDYNTPIEQYAYNANYLSFKDIESELLEKTNTLYQFGWNF